MQKAPDFTLQDQDGNEHSLKDYLGNWLVLYFYPKDETTGCTKEACAFRDEREVIAEHGAAVVGVSKDSVDSHRKFADHHQLNFTLLSDSSHDVIEAYGAWGPLGTRRMTFIINPEGFIAKEYKRVNPIGHAGEIVKDLAGLQNAD